MRRLDNKVVLITGAGAGLGRACALLFSREGASVAVADIDVERAQGTVDEVRREGGKAIAIGADVAEEDDVVSMIDSTLDAFGRLDVLHNNAGVPPIGGGTVPFEETSIESWRRLVGVNLTGVVLGCKHAVAPMRVAGGGSIINTSSTAAIAGYRGQAIYAASKAGVNGLTRALAGELGPYNIRVNAICPGIGLAANSNFLLPPGSPVKTTEDDGSLWNADERSVPLRAPRPPQLIDTALAALYLASDESMYISGQSLLIDGGQFAMAPGNMASVYKKLGLRD